MIRILSIFYVLIFMSACSSISYSTLPKLIKESIWGYPKIEVDQSLFLSKEYSFINVRINEKASALLTLYSIEDEKHKWIGANNEKIITHAKTGKILKTISLPNDISIISESIKIFDNSEGVQTKIFENPRALVFEEVSVDYLGKETIKFLDKEVVVDVFQERVFWRQLNKKKINLYYYKDSKIVRSKQNIHSLNGYFVIDYYFK